MLHNHTSTNHTLSLGWLGFYASIHNVTPESVGLWPKRPLKSMQEEVRRVSATKEQTRMSSCRQWRKWHQWSAMVVRLTACVAPIVSNKKRNVCPVWEDRNRVACTCRSSKEWILCEKKTWFLERQKNKQTRGEYGYGHVQKLIHLKNGKNLIDGVVVHLGGFVCTMYKVYNGCKLHSHTPMRRNSSSIIIIVKRGCEMTKTRPWKS